MPHPLPSDPDYRPFNAKRWCCAWALCFLIAWWVEIDHLNWWLQIICGVLLGALGSVVSMSIFLAYDFWRLKQEKNKTFPMNEDHPDWSK